MVPFATLRAAGLPHILCSPRFDNLRGPRVTAIYVVIGILVVAGWARFLAFVFMKLFVNPLRSTGWGAVPLKDWAALALVVGAIVALEVCRSWLWPEIVVPMKMEAPVRFT